MYIRNTIESVLGQTLKDIEILCIDAGSIDGTLEILHEYAKNDSRMRIIHSEKKSYGYQMNLGFKLAQGEYIGIVESDDFASPDMFEKLYTVAKKDNLDLAKSGFFNHYTKDDGTNYDLPVFIPNEAPKEIFQPLTSRFTESQQFFTMSPSIWTGLYNAKFLREYRIVFTETPGASYQDTAFTFKVWCCAKRVKFINECLLHYRRDNSESSSNSKGKVYCIMDEYREEEHFISVEHPQLKEKTEGIRCRLKFAAYIWNYNRLSMPEKMDFLNCASKEFIDDFSKKYFVKKYFTDIQWNELQCIAENPKAYHNIMGNAVNSEDKNTAIHNIISFSKKRRDIEKIDKFQNVRLNNIENPIVSVVIPVYNTADYVSQCIESIKNQSLTSLEIICIDDGSSDHSLAVLNEVARYDNRITILHSQKNYGQSVARNKGALLAKGRYIYFMDSDDLLYKEALRELVELMEKKTLDIIYFDADSFGDGADNQLVERYSNYYHRSGKYENIYTGAELMSLMERNHEYRMSPCLQVIRSSFYQTNKLTFPEGIIHEDNVFTFISMLLAKKVGYVNQSYYNRRVRPNSTMTRKTSWNHAYGYFKCYLEMIDFLKAYHGTISNEMCAITASVFTNGRNAYNNLPWNERSIRWALPAIEETQMNLYYEDSADVNLLKKNQEQLEHLQFDYSSIQNSLSFRIGRIITWLPRKCRGGIRCFQEHGITYTMKRFCEHLGIDMGTKDC